MRRLLSLLLCCLLFAGSLVAQSSSTSPAAAQEQTQEPQEPEEADPSSDTLPEDPFADTTTEQGNDEQTEQTDQGEGETAWEQLNAEREPAVTPSREDDPPETFSPLIIWRIIRSLWSKD